jgi:hypothetical protein
MFNIAAAVKKLDNMSGTVVTDARRNQVDVSIVQDHAKYLNHHRTHPNPVNFSPNSLETNVSFQSKPLVEIWKLSLPRIVLDMVDVGQRPNDISLLYTWKNNSPTRQSQQCIRHCQAHVARLEAIGWTLVSVKPDLILRALWT